jgi:hypothetical protein
MLGERHAATKTITNLWVIKPTVRETFTTHPWGMPFSGTINHVARKWETPHPPPELSFDGFDYMITN